MRILFIVPYTPTLIRVRPYNLVRALARRGHRVTLATLWEDAGERAATDGLKADGIEVIGRQLTRPRKILNLASAMTDLGRAAPPMPLQAAYCWQPALAQAIRAQLATRDFDVIHVEHLRGARYGLAVRQFLSPSPQPPLFGTLLIASPTCSSRPPVKAAAPSAGWWLTWSLPAHAAMRAGWWASSTGYWSHRPRTKLRWSNWKPRMAPPLLGGEMVMSQPASRGMKAPP